jgi:Na+/H+ antiporter NhaD/arsenite permease-like protein
VHTTLGEYLSFIILLFALYTVAGGILVTGDLRGTPTVNLSILVFGMLVASLVGTTGASMILIRPLIGANSFRVRNEHAVVFFISSSPMWAARSARSAIRRCSSASCTAFRSSGQSSICGCRP